MARKLRLTKYALKEMVKRNPPVVEKQNRKIHLSTTMSQSDLEFLYGPESFKSAFVEEVPETEEPTAEETSPVVEEKPAEEQKEGKITKPPAGPKTSKKSSSDGKTA